MPTIFVCCFNAIQASSFQANRLPNLHKNFHFVSTSPSMCVMRCISMMSIIAAAFGRPHLVNSLFAVHLADNMPCQLQVQVSAFAKRLCTAAYVALDLNGLSLASINQSIAYARSWFPTGTEALLIREESLPCNVGMVEKKNVHGHNGQLTDNCAAF